MFQRDYALLYLHKGKRIYDKGNYHKAKEIFKKVIKADDTVEAAWFNLGLSYRQLESTEKAIAAYKTAVKLNPKFHEAWYNLAVLYFHRNDLDKALEACEQCLQSNSDFEMASNLKKKILEKNESEI